MNSLRGRRDRHACCERHSWALLQVAALERWRVRVHRLGTADFGDYGCDMCGDDADYLMEALND